jgi:polyhydroxybutyrate depolymerase
VVDGVARHTITDIPSSYDSDKPTQLIIAWHGRTNSDSEVRSYYKVSRNAPNAIVVYPA